MWAAPADIRFKISPHDDLIGRKGGNWDRERRHSVEQTVKYRSIVQRFADGLRWEDTDLFRDVYSRRIRTEPIRGETTIRGLLAQYYDRVDGLFDELNSKGFRTDVPLPRFLIGRDGEVLIGNQGNHRLAMCRILGIRIAGEVVCRHKSLS